MESRTGLRKLVLALDAAALVASMLLAWLLHNSLQAWVPVLKEPASFQGYLRLMVLVIPTWLVVLSIKGLDRVFEERWTRRLLLWRLVQVEAIGLLALAAILFLTQIVINRSIIGLYAGTSFMMLYLLRVAVQLRLERRGRGQGRTRLVLGGTWGSAMEGFLRRAGETAYPPVVLGRLGPTADEEPPEVPRIGDLDDLDGLLHGEAVDAVLFFSPYQRPDDVQDALESCERLGITTGFHVEALHRPRSVPRISAVFETSFVLYEVSPKSPVALTVKHLLDLVGAGLVTLLAAPLLLVVAALIRVTMGPGVLFTQDRAGLNGRVFRMVKFRTMVRDAATRRDALLERNEMSGPVFKITGDERITPLGRFLRKWSIDELPQLFNVLQGTMSLVGPRPLPTYEQRNIRGDQRRRLSMRPGITGLWQVSGRNDVDFDRWMELDLRYIDEWSLHRDLRILFRTVGAVLLRKGAK
ncbi:MAG: exopolysaccharide biosynthesis polyprenyl glycosylphosphotransferase [Pseudomonadota bacterium]